MSIQDDHALTESPAPVLAHRGPITAPGEGGIRAHNHVREGTPRGAVGHLEEGNDLSKSLGLKAWFPLMTGGCIVPHGPEDELDEDELDELLDESGDELPLL